MAKTQKSTAQAEISKTGFNLNAFKKSNNLDNATKYKEQQWIPLSTAFQKVLSVPGIPKGHITIFRGNTDTGKTTALLEAAVSAQKMGVMPVFIITEMKWNWHHAKQMGFQVDDVVDKETGEITDYEGFFIYSDRSSLNTIEDVAGFIANLLDHQAKGNLPYDLLFLWDSVGSIPCKLSVESNKNNNEWNAGAMSTQFGNYINQKILLSRKENYPYTNTMVVINKTWVAKPATFMEQPKMKNKGGESMAYDATLMVTFGNVTNSGTSKIKATKNGKDVEFAKRTKVSVDKNHITGLQTNGRVIMTIHGFIEDDKKQLDAYKKDHSHEWVSILGEGKFDVIEDNSEWEESGSVVEFLSPIEDTE